MDIPTAHRPNASTWTNSLACPAASTSSFYRLSDVLTVSGITACELFSVLDEGTGTTASLKSRYSSK